MVVDLLRAVLADLHEEGVELRHDERDPDSEACVRHYRAGVASMAWGWTRCPVPLTVRGTQALVPLTVRGSDAKLIAARRRLAEEDYREDHECDVEASVPVTMAAAIVDASVAAEEEDRNDNYVEDLAEDVGPRDRRVPVWKSDFRRPGRPRPTPSTQP